MGVTISVTAAAVLLLMAASYWAVHYLVSLPYAPECPSCKCVTSQRYTGRLDRLFAHLGGADARHCPRCGWSGRMRWRLAAERVPRK